MSLWTVVALIVGGVVALLLLSGVRTIPSDSFGVVSPRFGEGRGPQVATLHSNTLYLRPRFLYRIELVPLVHVPVGTIGLVIARVGEVPRVRWLLGPYVECDHFRDGKRFLRGGGAQGRQLEVLTGGYYRINPHLFDVITVDTPDVRARSGLPPDDLREIKISVGETGVVVTHEGAAPLDGLGTRVSGHASFQLPWQFLANGGQRGVQAETLDEGGIYTINPWFAHVIRIPTRMLVVEWSSRHEPGDPLDTEFDQIVLDVQGHTIRFDLRQSFRIPAEAAPELVRRLGDYGDDADPAQRVVRRFVDVVLGAAVGGFFRRVSAQFTIQEFITRYDEVARELGDHVRQVLRDVGVEAMTTTLGELTIDEPEINMVRRRIALQRERVRLESSRLEELEARLATERVRSDIETQRAKVDAERRELEAIELKVLVELFGTNEVLAQVAKLNAPVSDTSEAAAPLHTLLQRFSLADWSPSPLGPKLARAPIELENVYRRNVDGEPQIVQALPEDERPDTKDVRALPVSIYLGSAANARTVEEALVELLNLAGIDIIDIKPPIFGSWLSLRLGQFRRLLTSQEAKETLYRMEQALTTRALGLPQAEIDLKEAEAAAKLIAALADQRNACIQVGSLLLVKVDGNVVIRNLTPRESSFLSRHQTALKEPWAVLNVLEKLANQPLNNGMPGTSEVARPELPAAPDQTDFT